MSKPHLRHRRRVRRLIAEGYRRALRGDGCSWSPDGMVVGSGRRKRYVSFIDCCIAHDADYRLQRGDRARSDRRLKLCLRCVLRRAGASRFEIWFYSTIYFRAVRWFGRAGWEDEEPLTAEERAAWEAIEWPAWMATTGGHEEPISTG